MAPEWFRGFFGGSKPPEQKQKAPPETSTPKEPEPSPVEREAAPNSELLLKEHPQLQEWLDDAADEQEKQKKMRVLDSFWDYINDAMDLNEDWNLFERSIPADIEPPASLRRAWEQHAAFLILPKSSEWQDLEPEESERITNQIEQVFALEDEDRLTGRAVDLRKRLFVSSDPEEIDLASRNILASVRRQGDEYTPPPHTLSQEQQEKIDITIQKHYSHLPPHEKARKRKEYERDLSDKRTLDIRFDRLKDRLSKYRDGAFYVPKEYVATLKHIEERIAEKDWKAALGLIEDANLKFQHDGMRKMEEERVEDREFSRKREELRKIANRLNPHGTWKDRETHWALMAITKADRARSGEDDPKKAMRILDAALAKYQEYVDRLSEPERQQHFLKMRLEEVHKQLPGIMQWGHLPTAITEQVTALQNQLNNTSGQIDLKEAKEAMIQLEYAVREWKEGRTKKSSTRKAA